MTNEVFNTDCLEYMRTLPDKAFQLAIADPPYGINRGGHNGVVAKDPRHNWKRYEFKQWDEQSPGAAVLLLSNVKSD